MKKHFMNGQFRYALVGMSAMLLASAVLGGCGTESQEEVSAPTITGAEESQAVEDESAVTPSEDAETLQSISEYTIIFDRNTTPDNTGDDETYEYTVTVYDETGTPVETTRTSVATVPYSEDAFIDAAPPAPTREGYYFAGWQTRPDVTEEDLIYGVSPYQWFFGTQAMTGGGKAMYIRDMENVTDAGTATLYARWVEMKDIATEEDLRSIGSDLYGAYQLTEDIQLTEPWQQIGCYYTNYEFYNPEWWVYAFRGILEGNGHTVSGLTVNGADIREEDYQNANAVWYDEGDSADGTASMFGALSCATIRNLTLKDAKVTVAGKYAARGDYVYAAPLAAFDMQSTLENITVDRPVVEVEISDEQSKVRSTIFTAVSGMVAGGWNDTITGCQVIGGQIRIDGHLLASHGGEVFVGGMLGESYASISSCTVDASITVDVADQSTAVEDMPLKVNVGGLDASNTTVVSSTIDSSISVNISKPKGAAVVNVGGLTGAQHYMTAEENTINTKLQSVCELDPEAGQLNVGRVCGSIDFYYITQILLYTPVASGGFSGNAAQMTWNGEAVEDNAGSVPSLDGQGVAWVNKGEYEIAEGYVVPSNIEALAEVYGSYMPVEYLQDGIIWIICD